MERLDLSHLDRLGDHRGVFEHAEGTLRREEHGYCTDDNARVLLVTADEADTGTARTLTRISLRFVLDAQDTNGRVRNRRDRLGRWTDVGSEADCWGRAVWALGVTAARHDDSLIRLLARNGYDKSVARRSVWPRAMAFAALGAAGVASVEPDHAPSRSLLSDALSVIGTVPDGAWCWPEPRLTYANATLAEAVIAAGALLDRVDALDRGLTMLGWLLDRETARGHLSVTPVGGAGPEHSGPAFDQQPIEVAALADACWRAFTVTGDEAWLRGVRAAAGWFDGDNDSGAPMSDVDSGGSYDGLLEHGVNRNQGAESTLALITTMQRARALSSAP